MPPIPSNRTAPPIIVATNPTYLCSKSCDIASESHSNSVSEASIDESSRTKPPNRFDLISLPGRLRKGDPVGIFGMGGYFPCPAIWTVDCPYFGPRRDFCQAPLQPRCPNDSKLVTNIPSNIMVLRQRIAPEACNVFSIML